MGKEEKTPESPLQNSEGNDSASLQPTSVTNPSQPCPSSLDLNNRNNISSPISQKFEDTSKPLDFSVNRLRSRTSFEQMLPHYQSTVTPSRRVNECMNRYALFDSSIPSTSGYCGYQDPSTLPLIYDARVAPIPFAHAVGYMDMAGTGTHQPLHLHNPMSTQPIYHMPCLQPEDLNNERALRFKEFIETKMAMEALQERQERKQTYLKRDKRSVSNNVSSPQSLAVTDDTDSATAKAMQDNDVSTSSLQTSVQCTEKQKGISDSKEDEAYRERRRRNNEAAKQSRDARRYKEKMIYWQNEFLENETKKLEEQILRLKQENRRLVVIMNTLKERTGHFLPF